MSLPLVQKKLLEHGIHVSYITLKRRSQAGALNSARRGRKFDFEAVLRLMASQNIQEPTSREMPRVGVVSRTSVSLDTPTSGCGDGGGNSTETLHAEMTNIAAQLGMLVPAVQRLEQAVMGLEAVRKMLMVKDDEARSGLRERLDAANAQIEALRGAGGNTLDVARMQASLARIAGMVERAPWLAE